MSEVIEQTVLRDYIVSHQKYVELKALQIQIGTFSKENRKSIKQFYQARRKFYHDKGISIPNDDSYYKYDEKTHHYTSRDTYEGFEFEDTVQPYTIEPEEARYLNIIYGIIKGQPYNAIEYTFREGNRPIRENVQYYGQKYKLLSKEIDIIWEKVDL
jgi:hypothetical protein